MQAGPDAAVQEQIEALTADNEADFRRRLALPTDPAALAAARGDADQALRTAERYSLPLTPEEEAEVERRSQLGEKIPALEAELLRDHADAFGGAYFDQARGVVVVAARGDGAALRATARRSLSDSELLIVAAKTSYGQLAQIHQRLVEEQPELEAAGVVLHTFGIDVVANVVEVGTNSLTDAAGRKWAAGYPAGTLSVRVVEPPSQTDRYTEPLPMEAGYEIRTYYTDLRFTRCTAAFAIQKQVARQGLFGPTYDTYYGHLTAGHCAKEGRSWEHGGVVLGNGGYRNGAEFRSGADAQPIYIHDKLLVSRLLHESANTSRSITSYQYAANDYVGQPVCQSGITSGKVCGTITNLGQTVQYSGCCIFDGQVFASYPSIAGDSGGPNYYGSTAMGVTSGVTGDKKMIYSQIEDALRTVAWDRLFTG